MGKVKEGRRIFRRCLRGGIQLGFATDDGAALHFIEQEFHRAVSSRPPPKVYRVERVEAAVRETEIKTDFLGGEGTG
jgi:dipeptidase E